MKHIRIIVVLCMICILTSCGKDTNIYGDGDTNVMGGIGEIRNLKCNIGLDGLYDDENVYLPALVSITPYCSYIKLTRENKVYVNCDIASCNHTGLDCPALMNKIYFMFGQKLYVYDKTTIKEIDNDKKVFTNSVPPEVPAIDADSTIDRVTVLDDEYALVWGNRYGYLIDDKFNILYTIRDAGDSAWVKVEKGRLYYVNDIEQMICVDVNSGDMKTLFSDKKLYCAADDEQFIFYSTTEYKLYRYNIDTDENIIIKDRINSPYFMAAYGYIYYQDSAITGSHKEIWDNDGNFVRDCTDYRLLDMAIACAGNNKIYTCIEMIDDDASVNNIGDSYITVMNPDGSDYHEYKLE